MGNSRHAQGYRMIGALKPRLDGTFQRMMLTVHRLAGMIKMERDLTNKEAVVRSCSNPLCVNPDHIIVGDLTDRNRVMMANGRHNPHRSRPHGLKYRRTVARYTDEEIRWIRSATTDEIAQRYSIPKTRASTMRWEFRKRYTWIK